MKVLNISRLGNQIGGLFFIGINAEGSYILCGSGERIADLGVVSRLRFYEYNPLTEVLKSDVFSDLDILYYYFELYKDRVCVTNGIGYFIEAHDNQIANIVKCDFNKHTYERMFSFFIGEMYIDRAQLIPFADHYLALKVFNKQICHFDIYDLRSQKKYDLIFSENDDMRYSDIHCIEVDSRPYLVFVKNGKSDWKMEFFIHKWEWTQEFIKYKDEKIFLFPLDELICKGKMCLDEACQIAHINETYDLSYLGYINNCIVYSSKDLRHYDEYELSEVASYDDNLFFYDVTNKITRSIPFDGHLLISNTGSIYGYKRIDGQLVIRNQIDNQLYTIPDQNGWDPRIINDLLVMRFKDGIVIYDLKKGIEVGKHYTENKYPFVLPDVRCIAALQQDYKYLSGEELLVLY